MSLSSRLRDRRGMAALEFAIILPVLALLLLTTADLVLWMRTWLRMEQAASEMVQIVTQYNTLYTSDFTATFLPVARAAVGGAAMSCSGGGVIVTGIDNSSGTPTVGWQWSSGSCAASSFTAGSGTSRTLAAPGGYAPPSGSAAVVVELFTTQPAYVFSQKLMATAGLSSIRVYAVAAPRSGVLPPITAGTRPS